MQVHRYPVTKVDDADTGDYIPKYDFTTYFFPQVELHEDINVLLTSLVDHVHIRQESLIHGDYNLGNVLEMEDQYTIIDWTNGQYGDPRYDMAWSVFLITIYNGEQFGEMYRAGFARSARYSLTMEEEQIFQAIACLRWVLLRRVGDVPMGPKVIERIRRMLIRNPYLNVNLL